MNVFFHVTTAIGIVAVVSDTLRMDNSKATIVPSVCAFVLGIIIHGVIDYMPHTYPFPAKVDVIFSLTIILLVLLQARRRYRLIVAMSFLGCVFPDLVDLLPALISKITGLNIPLYDKIFPFHQKDNSGSIFVGTSVVSDVNHISVLLVTILVIWCRNSDFKRIFIKKDGKL